MRRVAIFAGAATLALAPFALTDLGQGALVDITERAGDLWRPKHHETHLSRIQVWKSSASLAADHLPLGVGPGQFSSQLEPVYPGVGYAVHAHNQLIHTFVETGAIGVVGLLLLVLASIRTGLTAAFAGGGQRDRRILLVGATASLIAVTVHAQFESPLLVAPGVIAVGILTGALSAQATAGTSQTGPRRPRRSRQIVCALLLPIAAVQCVDTIAGVRSYRALAALQASPGQTPEDAERAVTLADSATEAAPYLPFTWLVAAHARRSAGDLIGTAAAYGRHEQLSPGVPTTVYQHAATLAMIGRFSDAIPLLERARRRSPDKRDAITLDLATSLLGAERPGEALVLLMELARAGYFAADPTVLRRMAECRIALGTGRVAALQALAAYENRLAPKEDPAVPILRKLANDLP